MKVPLSREERRKRFLQARRGWGYSKDMTRSEFLKMRDRAYMEKMKKEGELRKRGAAKPGSAKAPGKGRFGKVLIVVIVLGILVYILLRYFI